MPKAGRICCVPGCDSSPEEAKKFAVPLKFYKFPNDGLYTSWRKKKRQQWIDAVAIKNKDGTPWQPTKNTVICSAHFVDGKKSEDPRGPSYIPTLFPISYGTLNESKTPKKIMRISRKPEATVTNERETPLNPLASLPEGASVSNGELISTIDIVKEEIPPPISEIKLEPRTANFYELHPSTESVECQVNFPQDRQHEGGNIFICNMTVEKNICTAQVQVNIASKSDREIAWNLSRDLMNTRNIACGPSIYDYKEIQTICFQGITSIRNDTELVEFCGIPFATFGLLLTILRNIPGKKLITTNKLLMFLMKLKLGLSSSVLARLFGIHRTTVCKTFLDILQCLPALLEEYIYWPTKETVQESLPQVFKTNYPNCRVIMNCIESQVEAPTTTKERRSLYSHSLDGYTKKFLFAFTPNGFICFKSKFYDGRTSDEFIANDSEFLGFIESSDLVISDKRFSKASFRKAVEEKKASLLVVPFVEDPALWFSATEDSRKLASVRKHVKQCVQRMKTFQILSFLTNDMLPYADSIVHICCSLVNLQLRTSKSE